MSIPLDRLYHYIESVAQEVYGDTVIYRFYPHGSKKIEDISVTDNAICFDKSVLQKAKSQIQMICYDQEPLNFQMYENLGVDVFKVLNYNRELQDNLQNNIVKYFNNNLRSVLPVRPFNIYDKCVLLHSEKRSSNLELYQNSQYVPAYYWSHALIALDWFRYAEHVKQKKQQEMKTFLIYNRAWSGTREYRLKFADLLIDQGLVKNCLTTVGFTDNDLHYQQHNFKNQIWIY